MSHYRLVCSVLRDAVKAVQIRHPFTIDAWVLLPDIKGRSAVFMSNLKIKVVVYVILICQNDLYQ